MHYERRRKGRAIGSSKPMRRASGEGHITRAGYIIKSVDGKSRLAHRRIVEEHLGRPLERHETVHHVDGDRSNSATDGPLHGFRSGNLELWSPWQPSGQRVVDKVTYAVSLLAKYSPELLSARGRRLR